MWYDLMRPSGHGAKSKKHHKNKTAYQPKDTRPMGKHGAGGIAPWGYFSSAGTEALVKREGVIIITPNTAEDKKKKSTSSTLTIQTSKEAEEESSVLDWSSQSPDLNPFQNLWNDLKRLNTGHPLAVHGSEAFC